MRPSASLSSTEILREIQRKALHLPGLIVPWLGSHFPNAVLFGSIGISLLYLLSEQMRLRERTPLPIFGPLTRRLTRSEGMDLAPVFLALGLGFSAYFFPLKAALAGAILTCLCDGIAAVIGMKFGRHRLPVGNKSWEGSVGFFFSAAIFLLPVLPWRWALLVAGAGTVVEALSIRGIDNLLLPIIGAWLASL